jgi:hypothetical protein
MNQTERLLNAAADHIAATLEQPSDMRAWEQLLIYRPRTGAGQMNDAIAALAKRFWSVLPRDIQDLGITREQYYEQEMRALFATQADRIEQLEARLDRAVTRGLEQVERIATLEAQLPAEMQECTIRFVKCEEGHGSLTATNWVQHGCRQCRIATLEAALRDILGAYDLYETECIASAALAPEPQQ